LLPPITRDPDLLQSFLSDAAHVPGGTATGVVFPSDTNDVAAIVAASDHVLAVGAQSSLTGGATPRGDLIVSTRNLVRIDEPYDGHVTVGAGVALATLQTFLAARRLYYPPVPTFEGAFVGGTLATNAAGPATFRYGSARDWVDGITVVLADGTILRLRRGDVHATDAGAFAVETLSHGAVTVPLPTYTMPHVAKLSAGYFNAPRMDLIDLFVGSEGTLGIITEATLRVTTRPEICAALVICGSEAQALQVTAALRREPTIAIEYMDARSLRLLDDVTIARAGVDRPSGDSTCLVVQFDAGNDVDAALSAFQEIVDASGVASDPILALPEDTRTAARLFELREAVPAAVNACVAMAKAEIDPGIQKTAGDFIVPFEATLQALASYRNACEQRGLDFAIWGHVSDGNLHPNIIPHSIEDVTRGREALREMARGVIEMGGAPLAEHGVGRNALKQSFLVEMYGERGIEEMRAVKRALDPQWKLASGVLFGAQ
jgi:D-lactate dehydrogenase (cytochrome)